jgi:hypothetical protein
MSIIEDKGRKAVEAREHLQATMVQCATALAQAAEVMSTIAFELAEAARNEQVATQSYVIELEMRLNGQQAPS